jgi:hypothetical protein
MLLSLVYFVLIALFVFGEIKWYTTSNTKEKIKAIKVVAYSVVCVTIAVVLSSLFISLF